ncbi:MAG: PH domain-containing protein [Phenylobacterium sp.]|nr:PH domain-containing protein [Phenylobacterium sp.]MCA6237182.1 PH domain-containing protein [Phenylobacterium sp.]
MFDYQNASKKELDAEWQRIAKLSGDDQFFTKKELSHLPSILSSGEHVIAFASGLMDGNTWLIALTDRRVLFLDKGLLYGLKQVAVDLDMVRAVSGKTGMLFGKIQIDDGSSNRTIEHVPKATFLPFTNMVRDAIEARKSSRNPAPVAAPLDVVSQLERLGELRDRGVLTESEFLEQKAKLLAL